MSADKDAIPDKSANLSDEELEHAAGGVADISASRDQIHSTLEQAKKNFEQIQKNINRAR